MSIARLVRYLSIVGALVVLLSYFLVWNITLFEGREIIAQRPFPILLLGTALLSLSFISVTIKNKRLLPPIYMITGGLSFFIIVWEVLNTALRTLESEAVTLGPGALVAFLGIALYLIGILGSIQLIAEIDEPDEQNYHIVGV